MTHFPLNLLVRVPSQSIGGNLKAPTRNALVDKGKGICYPGLYALLLVYCVVAMICSSIFGIKVKRE